MHILYKIAIAALLVLGVFYAVGWYLSPQDELSPADAIVAISGDEGARLKTAIDLQKNGWAPRLIFSGAAFDPNSRSNAATMRAAAIKSGVDPALISVDESSKNTKENAKNSAAIIQGMRLETIILVTSPWHQRRAWHEFKQALGPDVDIINYSAKDKNWARHRWWLSSRGFYRIVNETPKLIYTLLH